MLQHEDLSVARLLIENGANVRDTGLLYVAAKEGPPGTITLLLEAGADPRLENTGGFATGLHGFGGNRDLSALEALLDAGAEINVQDFWGQTPIAKAMGNGNPAIIQRMIEAGTQTLKLNVKTGEKEGKKFWSRCGVLFFNTEDQRNITSINVKHNMFPGVDIVAFPKRDDVVSDTWTQEGLHMSPFRTAFVDWISSIKYRVFWHKIVQWSSLYGIIALCNRIPRN